MAGNHRPIEIVRGALRAVVGEAVRDFELSASREEFRISAQVRLAVSTEPSVNRYPGRFAGQGRLVDSTGAVLEGLRDEASRALADEAANLAQSPGRWQGGRSVSHDVRLPTTFCIESACGQCGGRMNVSCSRCGGSGRSTCSTCQGDGRVRCPSCEGRGERHLTAPIFSSNQFGQDIVCAPCGGSGRMACTTCGTSGAVACHRCGGAGNIPCESCGRTGRVTEVYSGRASISSDVSVEILDALPEGMSGPVHANPSAVFSGARLETPGSQTAMGATFSGSSFCDLVTLRNGREQCLLTMVGGDPKASFSDRPLIDAIHPFEEELKQELSSGLSGIMEFASRRSFAAHLLREAAQTNCPEPLALAVSRGRFDFPESGSLALISSMFSAEAIGRAAAEVNCAVDDYKDFAGRLRRRFLGNWNFFSLGITTLLNAWGAALWSVLHPGAIVLTLYAILTVGLVILVQRVKRARIGAFNLREAATIESPQEGAKLARSHQTRARFFAAGFSIAAALIGVFPLYATQWGSNLFEMDGDRQSQTNGNNVVDDGQPPMDTRTPPAPETTVIPEEAPGAVLSTDLEETALLYWQGERERTALWPNSAAQSRLERVGRRVVVASGLGGSQWEFALFDGPTRDVFVLPGGKVGLYRGLYENIQTDHEMAFAIAHSLAHVSNRDFETAQQIYALGGQDAPFAISDEAEADRRAVNVAHSAGYDVRVVPAYLLRLSSAPARAIHADPAGRAEEIRAWINMQGWGPVSDASEVLPPASLGARPVQQAVPVQRATLEGRWQGAGQQGNQRWGMLVEFVLAPEGRLSAVVRYPDLNCSGTWQGEPGSASTRGPWHVVETITQGTGTCINGVADLVLSPDGSLSMEWRLRPRGSVIATGVLRRVG